MKTLCLLLLLTIGLTKGNAQHCPFDGSTVILIQVKNKKGKPVVNPSFTITLTETPNAIADSCTYAAGQLQIPFSSIEKSWVNKYQGAWVNNTKQKLKDCNFKTTDGYMAVVLNQAQASCMAKNGNNFTYTERDFVITVEQPKGETQIIAVPASSKYALCTASGKWTRIKPIEIIVE